jgi:hypothetical protein
VLITLPLCMRGAHFFDKYLAQSGEKSRFVMLPVLGVCGFNLGGGFLALHMLTFASASRPCQVAG